MSRAKKMKREKKLKYLFKASGFVIGEIIGSFLGYQMAQFSKAGPMTMWLRYRFSCLYSWAV
jgi:hypothetical protein